MTTPTLVKHVTVGMVVAACTPRGDTAHAATVTSVYPDDAAPEDVRAYTMRGVCQPYMSARIGHLLFDADASHHGYRRTCKTCAKRVSS